MSIELQDEAPVAGLDWSSFVQQIVEDAEAALAFPFIVLSRFDSVARTSQPVFIGGLHGRDNQRALRLGQRFVPRFNLYTLCAVDAKMLLRVTFEGTEPVIGSVEDFTSGLMPPLIAHIAGRLAGAAHCLSTRLRVGNRTDPLPVSGAKLTAHPVALWETHEGQTVHRAADPRHPRAA